MAEKSKTWSAVAGLAVAAGAGFALWYFFVKGKVPGGQPPQQCLEGQIWDPAQNKCVPATTGGPKSSLGSVQISPI